MSAGIAFSSCIRSEAPGAECDIIAATIPGDVLNRVPEIGNDDVTFTLKLGVSADGLAPEFELTPGATIDPPSGTPRDFTTPLTYTVTSESGEWQKVYTVYVKESATISLNYKFENVKLKTSSSSSYDIFYDVNTATNDTMFWASGNAGFVFTGVGTTPETFPTYQGTDGRSGKCAVLTTRSTGFFGTTVGKPIAAGSIFIGKFNSAIALTSPLKATQFGAGAPFLEVPSRFSGYYSYTPGPVYYQLNDKKKPEEVPGKLDECNIYAVFFETSDEVEWLDGTNVLAADNKAIIATAELPAAMRGATDGWVRFDLPFAYREDAVIDPVKLAQGRYSMAIVASSSIDGDFFRGAPESTLKIDSFQLTCFTPDDFR